MSYRFGSDKVTELCEHSTFEPLLSTVANRVRCGNNAAPPIDSTCQSIDKTLFEPKPNNTSSIRLIIGPLCDACCTHKGSWYRPSIIPDRIGDVIIKIFAFSSSNWSRLFSHKSGGFVTRKIPEEDAVGHLGQMYEYSMLVDCTISRNN